MYLDEYARCDGLELAQLIRQKKVSHIEIVKLASKAIDSMNKGLNFLAHKTEKEMKMSLENIDYSRKFCGVPTLIKDTEIRGQPFELGSRIGIEVEPDSDSEMTTRLKQSGVTIMGISTMPEWGGSPTTESILYGATRNPWNVDYIAGGSSGGAAAAVASGVVPFAHASDAGGSIRIPASCCGVVGLKPTRARTPGAQFMPFSPGVGHIISRSVRDTAAMLDSIHGNETGAIYSLASPNCSYLNSVKSPIKQLKIAYTTVSPSGSTVDKENIEAVEKTIKHLELLGHCVNEIQLPYGWEALFDSFIDLWSFRHPHNAELFEKFHQKQTNSSTKEANNLAMLEHAKSLSISNFDKSLRRLGQICIDVATFFEKYDVFVSPVTTTPPLKIGAFQSNAPDLTVTSWTKQALSNFSPFTPIFNITGQPAISLPIHHSKQGLPIGVQIAGKYGDEETLIKLAGLFERDLPWAERFPPASIFTS